MIERGKFRSLTLINWNGFFARTFDLDELVTTLSGGNGAGKSTTMAAFITAMIPISHYFTSVILPKQVQRQVHEIKGYTVNYAPVFAMPFWMC